MTATETRRMAVRSRGGAGARTGIRTDRRPFRPGRLALSALGVVIALIWVFPVYWMLNSSFLDQQTLDAKTPTWTPFGGSIDNFVGILTSGTLFRSLGVSVLIAVVTVTVCLLFAFLAALAISRFRFRGRKAFVIAVLLVQMLPAEGLFIAQYKLVGVSGVNPILGVSILYIAAVVPFTIWMLRGFVAGVPVELEEAAMVDGLSRTQAFMRITFPLLAPGLVASGVYAFLQAWNEFTVALVILQDPNQQTLPLWLRGFIQQSASHAIDWGEVMAASTLVAVPVIVFFVFVQGRMTSGLVSGAVKG